MQTAHSPYLTPAPSAAASDVFAQRYGITLPRAMRTEAAALSWPEFLDRYCPTGGPIRLDSWAAGPCVAGMWRYEATLELDERPATFVVSATGPLAALTAMLYEAGAGLEILEFHQFRTGAGMATVVRCERDGMTHYAAAIALDGTESAVRAVIAAANILA